ncbi:GNAT family N-acetyltransferase [Streptosporangium canum]|uniref:GNAT family N-acetyltransferase n=1 Tax=Streptosporangium canum TaxID=324952 RepID=UPI0033AD0CA7
MFTAVLAGTDMVTGFCDLGRTSKGDLELSCAFLPEHWGVGYAREACAAVLAWAFENVPNTDRVVAITQAANLPSIRLLESLGMIKADEFVEFGAPQVMYATSAPI